jgi:hypothetical protein
MPGTARRVKPLLALVAIMSAALPAYADVTLEDRATIVESLKFTPPCCVVDGRSPGLRQLRPLKDAVVWQKGVRIQATGAVVVIADSDQKARALARRIARQFDAKTVIAVKGGFDTWRDVTVAAQEPGMPATFVIPKNTCEQGTPLQTLRSNRK